MNISLKKYGPMISSESIGKEIYKELDQNVKSGTDIVVDLSDIDTMATFCAKQIFGRLYVELGSELFYTKVKLKGANNDLKAIIQIGIQHALDDD